VRSSVPRRAVSTRAHCDAYGGSGPVVKDARSLPHRAIVPDNRCRLTGWYSPTDGAYHGLMIRTAYLRVYQPEERLQRYPAHASGQRSVVRVDDQFLYVEPMSDDALLAEWNGAVWVCPRHPWLRMMEGVVAFRNAHPGSPFMTELAVRRAAQELHQIKSDNPSARSHILSVPWHVPLRWFACYVPDEREVYNAVHGPSIRYRTTVALALDRMNATIETLEGAGFDDAIVSDAADLEDWIGGFEEDAMLELDYHTVARHFADSELVFDESAADVQRSLEALRGEDWEAAGQAYSDVASRWMSAQSLTYIN